jgi:hypothetical protein
MSNVHPNALNSRRATLLKKEGSFSRSAASTGYVAVLSPRNPVIRFTLLVSYSNDFDELRLNTIDERKREARKNIAPLRFGNSGPAIRTFGYDSDRMIYFKLKCFCYDIVAFEIPIISSPKLARPDGV